MTNLITEREYMVELKDFQQHLVDLVKNKEVTVNVSHDGFHRRAIITFEYTKIQAEFSFLATYSVPEEFYREHLEKFF